MDVSKGKYSAGGGNIYFSVDEACWLPPNSFSEQYPHELSPETHVLAMVRCSIPAQNFLICKLTFKMIFHFEKLTLPYIEHLDFSQWWGFFFFSVRIATLQALFAAWMKTSMVLPRSFHNSSSTEELNSAPPLPSSTCTSFFCTGNALKRCHAEGETTNVRPPVNIQLAPSPPSFQPWSHTEEESFLVAFLARGGLAETVPLEKLVYKLTPSTVWGKAKK